jgi:hypothetical protein
MNTHENVAPLEGISVQYCQPQLCIAQFIEDPANLENIHA